MDCLPRAYIRLYCGATPIRICIQRCQLQLGDVYLILFYRCRVIDVSSIGPGLPVDTTTSSISDILPLLHTAVFNRTPLMSTQTCKNGLYESICMPMFQMEPGTICTTRIDGEEWSRPVHQEDEFRVSFLLWEAFSRVEPAHYDLNFSFKYYPITIHDSPSYFSAYNHLKNFLRQQIGKACHYRLWRT